MQKISKLVLQGLMTILPLGLTLYFIYWLLATIEHLVKPVVLAALPETLYFPGLGVIVGLVLMFFVGLLVNAYAIRYLVNLGDRIVERIPLVKSVFGALQDIISVFQLTDKNQMQAVVSVDIDENTSVIGFVTGEKTGQQLFGEDRIGVYVPLSYQIGGLTVYLPRDRIKPLNIGVEEAMRIALTGGAQRVKN